MSENPIVIGNNQNNKKEIIQNILTSNSAKDADKDGTETKETKETKESKENTSDNNNDSYLEYKSKIISSLPKLTHLDLSRISDTDRREANRRNDSRKDQERDVMRKKRVAGQREIALDNIKHIWKKYRKDNGYKDQEEEEEEGDCSILSSSSSNDTNSNNTFSEIEVHNGSRRLCIYGDDVSSSSSAASMQSYQRDHRDHSSSSVLENVKFQSTTEEISWNYTSFDKIIKTFGKLHSFERLRKVMFCYNGIDSFNDLDELKRLPSSVTEIYIDHNTIVSMVRRKKKKKKKKDTREKKKKRLFSKISICFFHFFLLFQSFQIQNNANINKIFIFSFNISIISISL